MSRPITLTAGTVAWLARCERRVWLDIYGDRAQRVADSPVAARRAAAGVVHEAALMAAMLEPAQPVVAADWPALVGETGALMRAGAAEIRQGGLEAAWGDGIVLCGRPDVLRRVARPSELGAWSYEPVEIKQHAAAQPRDALQLDLYRWLLAQVQGDAPEGELWLGAQGGRPQAILRRAEPLAGLERQLLQVAGLREDAEPAIVFARHCAYCAWRSACDEAARGRQDIALLAGLDRRAAAALRADGHATLADVAALPAARLARYRHVGAGRAAQLHSHARALICGAPHRRAQAPAPLPAAALFFDIESRPDTQEPWAFGWLDGDGAPGIAIVSARHVSAGARGATIAGIPLVFVPDAAAGWAEVAARAARAEGAILHWGGYERECLDRTAGAQEQASLRPRLADLHAALELRYALPIARGAEQTAGSLKAVGAYLGHGWPHDADWLVAWTRYVEWRDRAAPDTHLAPGLAYLHADLAALRHVWGWLREGEACPP